MQVGLFGICMGCMGALIFESLTSSCSFDVLHIVALFGGNSLSVLKRVPSLIIESLGLIRFRGMCEEVSMILGTISNGTKSQAMK
jgi:hypothetical protein